MSAYMVFTREKILDEAELAIYSEQVRATFAGHEVKVHVAYGAHQELEGPPNEGTVVLEFPSKEAAMAWYESDTYRKVREHRFKGAIFRMSLVEGA